MAVEITKRSGEHVKYNARKLRKSLKRSGASVDAVKEIITEIEKTLYPGITTKEIFQKAFALLRKGHRATAAKYNLRNAILAFGPTGFPFERYVSHLMEAEGYTTKVSVIIEGKCVNHEVDVVAEKGREVNYLECKFHNKSTFTSDVKTPLYIHSRFLDIMNKQKEVNIETNKNYSFWIVTNTNFTSDATTYANCSGLQLLSWNYPPKNGIRERIDKAGLHPITCLTTLTKKEKFSLIKNDIILCRHIMHDAQALEKIGISKGRISGIMGEAKALFELK